MNAWKTFIAISVCASLILVGAFAVAQSAAPAQKEATVHHATGPFDVKMTPPSDKTDDGLTRMTLDKQYHGDLQGTGKGQMLTNGINADKSGAYVAMETVSGTLQGKSGTFVMYHTGTMTRGTPALAVLIAPGSGTGGLAGIEGKMTINIAAGGKHSYELEYTLPSD